MDEVIFEEFKGTGNMEINRIQEVIDKIVNAGFDVDPSRTDPNNIVTNEFIDESIGF